MHNVSLATAAVSTAAPQPAQAAQTLPQPSQPVVANTAATLEGLNAHLRVGTNSSELKISVQLPSIGKVEVRAVSTGQGAAEQVTAHVTAQRVEAVQALDAERNTLEQSLRAHDVMLGSFGSSSQGQAQTQQQQQQTGAFVQQFQSTRRTEAETSNQTGAIAPPVSEDASISVLA